MRRLFAFSVLAVVVASGCTSRLATSNAVPKTRTYTQNIQPLTSDQRCQDCHLVKRPQGKVTGLGTYAYDSTKRTLIRDMAQTYANPAHDAENGFLTPEQIKDVYDWWQAGAPNDDQPF